MNKKAAEQLYKWRLTVPALFFSNKSNQAIPYTYPRISLYSILLTRIFTIILCFTSITVALTGIPQNASSLLTFSSSISGTSGQLQLLEISSLSISGSITLCPLVQVLQPHLTAPVNLSQPHLPSVVFLSSWHTLTALLTPRGFYSKANVPVYVYIVYCCDIQSVNNFCNIAQLPKHTAHSLGNHAHSVASAGSVAQASWMSGLEGSRTSH